MQARPGLGVRTKEAVAGAPNVAAWHGTYPRPLQVCVWISGCFLDAVFHIGLFLRHVLEYRVRMKKKELTPEQLVSIPCPTCGVAAGERCVLHSGTPRSEPHVDRKLSAIDAIQGK